MDGLQTLSQPAEVIDGQHGPAMGRFALKTKRIESFVHWPQAMTQRPEELAEAGFYYRGTYFLFLSKCMQLYNANLEHMHVYLKCILCH